MNRIRKLLQRGQSWCLLFVWVAWTQDQLWCVNASFVKDWPRKPRKEHKNYLICHCTHQSSAIFYCTPTILQATSVVYWHQGTLLLYDHVLISTVQALAGSSSSVPVKWNKQKPSSLLEYCRVPFFITYSWISQSMLSRFLLTGRSLSTFLTSKSMKRQSHEQFPAIVYTKQ
jgi:hypothetical protein